MAGETTLQPEQSNAFAPLADRKLETWSHCANALPLPPPHGCKHQVCFVSMCAISAYAILRRAYVLQ